MSLLDTITKGRRPRYIWALIYGTDGVGKSSMCSHAPNPIFVGAEKGTEQLDVARFPQVESIGELFAQLRTLQLEKYDFQTVVLDSLDWIEPLIHVRDLAFAYFRPDQFPTHSALVEQLLYNRRGGLKEREESDRVGKLLRAWSRDGERGKLFDGVSNVRIDGRVAHFELGQIPEHATEMRAAANFLVANYGRQKIISMPRAVPKIALFEEAARTLDIPGGIRMIQEYYRQMRKFGCNILAVVQQYDVLRDSLVRGAMIGNSKMFLELKFLLPLKKGVCRKSPDARFQKIWSKADVQIKSSCLCQPGV
jgi:hypothetical protein